MYNNDIENDKQVKYLELIQTQMSPLQNKIYNTIKIEDDEDIEFRES